MEEVKPRIEDQETSQIIEFGSMDDLYKYEWSRQSLGQRFLNMLTQPSGGYVVDTSTAPPPIIGERAKSEDRPFTPRDVISPNKDIDMRIIAKDS